MMTNSKVLPVQVVAAIVARFDSNLDTLHYSSREVMLRINEAHMEGEWWVVSATHISGQDMRITLMPDTSKDFGYAVSYSVLYQGEWYNA